MLLIGTGKRASIAALAAVLLAALALGCGGSSDAAPLKKPQFVKQANAICTTAQGEREAQGRELAKQGEEGELSEDPEEAMREILEPVNKMIEELGDLGPPEGQEKQVEAIIGAYEEAAEGLEANPGEPASVSAFDRADRLAREYGLTDCTI